MAEEIYHAVGKRKTSIARIWMKPGSGRIMINNQVGPGPRPEPSPATKSSASWAAVGWGWYTRLCKPPPSGSWP